MQKPSEGAELSALPHAPLCRVPQPSFHVVVLTSEAEKALVLQPASALLFLIRHTQRLAAATN